MRYEDASQAGSVTTGSDPVARPDVETLPPSSNGPGNGNAISGMGTNSGASGADQVADGPAVIIELRGALGAGASNGNGFEAAGQYGTLSMDPSGNFNYVRTTPADGVQDIFNYTLADAKGARSSTTLTVEIPRVIDEQAMVNLPAGVQMSDIRVSGRDLVIQMPDGSQMVIPGGAVFVPELSIGDVIIPPTNLAALLIDSEPQPAAGPPLSSGGNFADDVPDLDPGVPLGDLIPPTELDYTPPDYEEPMEIEDREPTIIIVTPDNPAGAVNATASVDESGLPERNGEPEGTLEPQNIETTTGSIVFTAEDGLEAITINGTAITGVGQEIEGEHGILTITSIDLENGTIGYSYTATDNTTDGVDDFEDFIIVVTDDDGDTATGSLHIDILDDEPLAEDDVDTVNLQTNTATGNVMTGIGTNAGAASGDTVGADNATLTAIAGEGGSDSSFDSSGNLVVDGEYGTLTIDAEGNYTYVPFADAPGGTEDVFTYTLTDGDGDVITATLTIINPDQTPSAGPNAVVQLDDDVLGGNPGGPNDDPNSVNATGTLSGSGGDGQLTFDLLTTGAPDGFTYVDGPNGSILVQQVQDGVAVTVLTITVDPETGAYTVVQNANILHPEGQTENNTVFTINYTVTDADGDAVSSTLVVNVDDDTPLAFDDTETMTTNETQETGNVITGAGTNEGTGNADQPGADGFAGIVALEGANSSDANGSNGFEVQGEFGTLTMDAEGNYTYVRDPNILEGGNDVFTYTYVDGDGDTVEATLTILVPDIDLVPVANPPAAVIVDDDDVGNDGNPGGVGDADPANASGTLTATGGNGDSDFFFDVTATANGLPAGFSLGVGSTSTSLLIMQGQTLVMTVTLNSETGQYTVVQNAPIDHSAGGNENNAGPFNVVFNAIDEDGSVSPDQTLVITVDDDTPEAYDDTDTLGQDGQAAGNVISGVGTNEGTGNADSPGADGFAGIVGLVGANGTDTDASGGFVVEGVFGTLTMDANGEYTYVRDPENLEGGDDVFTYTYVDGDGDTVEATLTIAVPNIDLVPTANPPAPVIVDDDDVAGANGNPGGVDDNAPANATGTLTATGGDGDIDFLFDVATTGAGLPAGFTLGAGSTTTSLLIMQGTTLVMTVTLNSETGQYTVVQNAPIDHAAGGNENNAGPFNVVFNAIDEDGSVSPDQTLAITVDDDTPLATNDTNSIASGQFGPVNGNVITNDAPGADGFGAVVGVAVGDTGTPLTSPATVGVVIQGTYGDLTLNADGTYSYLRDAGTPGGVSDVFTYTYVDGDGDLVTATLTISIGNSTPTANAPAAVIVDDDDVAGANGNPGGVDDNAPANATGTLTATGGDGDIDFLFDVATTGAGLPAGFTLGAGSTTTSLLIMQGTTLVMTVTLNSETGQYTVVQNAPIDHAAGGNENNAGPFNVVFNAIDEDGSVSPDQTLAITVDDDTPLATNDTNSIASGQFGPVNGNVITNDAPGADGFGAVVGVAVGDTGTPLTSPATVGVVIQGTYGDLTLNADGTYSYLRDAGTPGGVSDVFTYTYVDGDGDLVTATLTISIGNSTPTANAPAAVIVDDDDVAGANGNPGGVDDNAPANATGTLTATGGDGDIDFLFDVATTGAGLPAGFTLGAGSTTTSLLIMQGTTLVMTVTLNSETGQYTVVQNAPIDHAAGGNENNAGPFNVVFNAIDEDGSVSPDQTLAITVDDDTPLATNDTNSIASGQFGPVNGNVITNDAPGADGFGAVVGVAVGDTGTPLTSPATVGVVIQGTYGDLTLNADGTYSYLRDAGTPGGVSDVFTYTYVDGDGDLVTATLTISIGNSTPTANAPAAVIVDDDDVAGANGNPGGVDDNAPANATGTLTATGGDGDIDFLFDVATTGAGLPAGFTLGAGSTTTSLLIMQGTTLVMTVTLNSETGQYTVVQNAPIDHAAGGNENNAGPFNVVFNAIDEDGSVSPDQTLAITVDDDTPLATNDTNSIASGQFGPVNGNVITNDAPGADGFGAVVGVAVGDTGTPLTSPATVGVVIQGTYGDLTLNADGTYSYLRDAGTPGGVSDVFTYTYVDGDGDLVTATLTISIGNSTPTANAPAAVIVDDDDVAGANGNPGGVDDNAPANATGTLTATGGDGDIDFLFDVATTGAGLPAGFTLGAGSTTTSLLIMQGTTLVMTVTLNSETGQYTVVQNAPIDHAAGGNENNAGPFNVVFNAIDEDGSVSPDQTLAITVDDDTPTVTSPGLGSGSVTVDETGPLAGGAPAPIALTDGVDTYVAGNDEDELGAGRIASATSTGGALATATISFGADGPLGGDAAAATTYALQISVSGASGVTTTEGEAIKLVQLDNGIVLGIVQGTGEHAGQVAFAISINADTGALQVDQYLSLDHPTNPNPNESISLGTGALSVVVSATDDDGDTTNSTAVDISTRVTFLDDGPTLGAFTDAVVPNEDNAQVNGTYVYDWGADGLGALTVTGPVIPGITYTSTTALDGTVTLHGMSGTTEVFNLVVRPDGTYTFNLLEPDEATDITYDLTNLESGNANFTQTLDGLVEFSPFNHLGADTGSVNSSNVGFGVGNQFTGNGEAFTMEFHTPGQAGDQAAGTNPDFVSSVAFTVPANGMNGSTVTLTWYAYNTVTNQMETGTIVVNDSASAQQIVIDPSIPFNVLVVEGSNADGQGVRLTELTVSQTILPQDQELDFTINATDGDGDPTLPSTLTVEIDADAPPPAPLMATQESQESASADMSATVIASNDNADNGRAFVAGNQAALMGVIAAAGLEMSGRVAEARAMIDDIRGGSVQADGGNVASLVNAPGDGGLTSDLSAVSFEGTAAAVSAAVQASAGSASDANSAGLDAANDDSGADLSALAAGTEASDDGAQASAMTAAAVAMPSMEMVAALEGASQSVAASSDSASVAQTQEVGRVLADALAGGNGPDIGALVEALGGAGAESALEALASLKAGGVSFGHNDGAWAFANGHSVFSMDAVAHHQDATPA